VRTEPRLLIPVRSKLIPSQAQPRVATDPESYISGDESTGDQIQQSYYILPFGMKKAVLGLLVSLVCAGFVGASIKNVLASHAVDTAFTNSSVSLWVDYPEVTQKCAGAITQCTAKCYHEEQGCNINKGNKCAQKGRLCKGIKYDGTFLTTGYEKASCRQQEIACSVDAACLQGHRSCQLGTCFNAFVNLLGANTNQPTDAATETKAYTAGASAAAVWKTRAVFYDKCVEKGCDTVMQSCIAEDKVSDIFDTTVGANLGKAQATFKVFQPDQGPNAAGAIADRSGMGDGGITCKTQEYTCRAKCYEVVTPSSGYNMQKNMDSYTIATCEAECQHISHICARYEACSDGFQQCAYSSCASLQGSPLVYDTTVANYNYKFKDKNDLDYYQCRSSCKHSLAACIRGLPKACVKDSANNCQQVR